MFLVYTQNIKNGAQNTTIDVLPLCKWDRYVTKNMKGESICKWGQAEWGIAGNSLRITRFYYHLLHMAAKVILTWAV